MFESGGILPDHVRGTRVHGNDIGVNVQGGSKLGEGVRFSEDSVVIDNTLANFDAKTLPLPALEAVTPSQPGD